MTTYRRFTCVERSISMFLNQDYTGETELIILNTDEEYPLILGEILNRDGRIKIINNNIDSLTGKTYDNIGSIRRDALSYATGTHYICWDDDDIFLPWNIRQCVDGLQKYPLAWAWKPNYSMYWDHAGNIQMFSSTMEASIISDIEKIKTFGFNSHKGGGEHLSWFLEFKKNKKIIFDDNTIPGYCFNWSDSGTIRGHKQSASIDNPDNFNIHKKNTNDFSTRPLRPYNSIKLSEIYIRFKNFIEKTMDSYSTHYSISKENFDKYVMY